MTTRYSLLVVFLSIILYACQSQRTCSLTIPYQPQTKSNYCVPACASMVLEYYGDHYSQDTVKALAKSKSDFTGTYYADLVQGLKSIGYRWEIKTFSLDHLGFEQGLNAIRVALQQHRPVLISTSSPPIGHTKIVCGYNDRLQMVELVDPLWPPPGEGSMSYRQLEDIWHDDFQHTCRSILVTAPRSDDHSVSRSNGAE
ncbi:MAG: C39 family peptidase [Bacteroidota bacterium]|nr:C39 family peptidase [Bacteroidota bacterium]MDP4231956.1 C39 family peptidase [Bacteroidota bacterium]MDP4241337.1 C39 family peptidase [Bacteroidota bacterium]MDP4287258.1 C39 family peptidase [Bacteroidota bacterium]